jgi:hypothetical protein
MKNLYPNTIQIQEYLDKEDVNTSWTTERGGGVNQLLLSLNNYASF